MVEYYKNRILENLPYTNEEGLTCLEKFKDIPGYEGLYQVSDLGRVKSLITNIILSIQFDKYGYNYVSFGNKKYKIHQLVAKTFIPNLENKPTVNHKDEIKTNNKVNNLEWFTVEEQNKYSRGINIKLFYKGFIRSYPSVLEASSDLNLDPRAVVNLNKQYMKLLSACQNILTNNTFSYKPIFDVSNIEDCKGIIVKGEKYNVRVSLGNNRRANVGDYSSLNEAIDNRNKFIIENNINQPLYNIKNEDLLKDSIFSRLLLLENLALEHSNVTINKIVKELTLDLRRYLK